MNVSCPECSTVYRVDPAKVPQGGVRARCSTCSGVIDVGVAVESPRRVATPSDPIGQAFAPRRQTPAPFMPASTNAAPPTAVPRPTPPTPSFAMPVRTPSPSPRIPTPAAAPRVTTPAATSPALGASLPPLRSTPHTPWLPAPIQPISKAQTPVSVPPMTPAAPSPVAPVSTAPASPPAPGERRPINPFLARDPGLRAKRLARALVSDMVAYYPAKHSEGLEKGTLKELFKDEIKKSYDEYVAQVGADFARTTTHFQESLNEILGAGKKIF